MTTRLGMDADGDVDMTVPQPVYEFIAAPRLVDWDQKTLIVWMRDWEQYESKMRHRCSVTGETYEHVVATIKDSIKPSVLDMLALYVLKRDKAGITDVDLRALIGQRCATLMNGFVPDLTALFQRLLVMDMSIQDCDNRVFKYFGDFNDIIKANGLEAIIGRGNTTDANYRDRMKTRCSLLVSNLQPAVLKTQIQRLVALERRDCKTDDVALYALVLEHAKAQQRYHIQLQEQRTAVSRGGGQSNRQARGPGRAGPGPSTNSNERRPAGSDAATSKGQAAAPRQGQPPRDGCLVCKGPHWLKDCPTASEEQRQAALKLFRESRTMRTNAVQAKAVRLSSGDKTVRINGLVEVAYVADTGAERSMLPKSISAALQLLDPQVAPTTLRVPVQVSMADGTSRICSEEMVVDLELVTAAGMVRLHEVSCLLLESASEELLLGNDAIKSLGIDVDRLLEQMAGHSLLLDEKEYFPVGDGVSARESDVGGAGQHEDPGARHLLDSAIAAGLPLQYLSEMEATVLEHPDVWRAALRADPPARVEPMKVTLRQGAEPFKCKPRKYSPLKSEFMRRYTAELEACGLIRKNSQSRWASPALPVRKPGTVDEYRITIDYRAVNHLTVPLVGTMPNLSVVSAHVSGACAFAKFDLMKGFWQLPLDEASQEMLSFMTEDAVFTPLRVPQGAMDSAIHFQTQMQAVLEPMLYKNCLVWIDDVIVYAKTLDEFLAALRQFFGLIQEHNLKLSPAKSSLYMVEVMWCGKVLSGKGVRHDPRRVDALASLPLPTTVGDLQYFIFAANWLHESIVDYARMIAPLLKKLDEERKRFGKPVRNAANKAIEWTAGEEANYMSMLSAIQESALLHFPTEDSDLCLFTDASQFGWAIVVTQVEQWEPSLPVEKQSHRLVICKGGIFKGSMLHWPIIEKEAFPIVKACSDLEYLLLRRHGFKMFCDHSNLIYVFAPHLSLKVHVRDRLQRWAMRLCGLRYSIEHIGGETNIWADIVSRWHASTVTIAAVRTRSHAPLSPLRPLDDSQFVWPGHADIRNAQQECLVGHPDAADGYVVDGDGILCKEGKAWIPREARELMIRLFIIAHCGSRGHRSAEATIAEIECHFCVDDLRNRVDRLVRQCLICKHVKGPRTVQRPWGPAFQATRRNEAVHWDFLFLGDARFGSTKYVLALKDDLSHYCELFPCASADAESAADGLLQWYKRYGCPEMLFSDQGTHFRNATVSALCSRLKIELRFSPVYTPWLNGTIERLNRDILQVLRALLIEYHLDYREWPYLLPVVQASLNHTIVESLGGRAPIEVFLALPPPSPFQGVFEAKTTRGQMVRVDVNNVGPQMDAVRQSLAAIHKEVVDIKERRRLQARAAKKGFVANYDVGDYVLWSRVDQRLAHNKLLAQWVGPFRVIEARPHTFIIRHLLTGADHEVHPTRLKFYADSSLDETVEIKEFVSEQGLVLDVKKLKEHRFNERLQRWELLVSWAGLEAIEDSWEPLAEMATSIPQLVSNYAAKAKDARLTTALTA